MSKVASRKSKVEGRRSKVVGTHGRASVLQNRTASQHNQFMLRRFIFRLGSRSGFSHTKTTKCELAMLEQHILLNVFAHKNLFPTSTKCRQIESPHRLNIDSPISRLVNKIIASPFLRKPTFFDAFLLFE